MDNCTYVKPTLVGFLIALNGIL
ncbi:Protein of unknown function [Leuconostoc citreum]|nr:Protein of unknown function [Leuconostoc citreum]